jgi:general secretion pathway protein D
MTFTSRLVESRLFFRSAVLVLLVVVAGCQPQKYSVPAVKIAKSGSDQSVSGEDRLREEDPNSEQAGERKLSLLPVPERQLLLPPRADLAQQFSGRDAVTVSSEGLPARNFVNYVFGEVLKVNYVVVEGAAGLDKPITLNASKPISSRQLFRMASELLADLGLSIAEREKVFFIGPADAKSSEGLPIGYGRNPQDVPDIPGTILQIVPLRYGPNLSLQNTAIQLTGVSIAVDNSMDAYFVTGNRAQILKMLDLVKLFDQPSVKGSRIGLVTLTYIGAQEFIEQVKTLLANEGIVVGGNSPLSLVPIDRLGGVVIFSSSDAVIERVEFWAKQLDQPGKGPAQRFFIYTPKYARAADLGESLAPLIGVGPLVRQGNQSRDTRSAFGAGEAGGRPVTDINAQNVMRRDSSAPQSDRSGAISIAGEGITLSIDARSNSLIFYTTGQRYEALLPMIARLDTPPKQIVLEATIAEVSLTGEFANGVEFAFRDNNYKSGRISGGTLGSLGLPSGGLAIDFATGIADQIRLRLQQSDNRINVLSNPILVVRDGVAATIMVGNEVPTVGATASSPLESDRTVTTVLYRSTGLQLSITPSINAQGLVLMTIQQSNTSALPGSSGVAGAPVFFQRSVSTEVVANSGQTVLLAGLISESNTRSSDRVPGLGSLPGVGALFSSNTRRNEKTELVVLITPRIIDRTDDWGDVMQGLKNSMSLLSTPSPTEKP